MGTKGTLSVLLIIFAAGLVHASPAALTYQGRIVKSNGQALEYAAVAFEFTILAPNKTCVLYREQLNNVNMVNSGGVFDVKIGNAHSYPGSNNPGFTILDAFNNGSPLVCDGNSPYSPGLTDGRFLRVRFYDGAQWNTISPDSEIRTVPFSGFAASAAKLGSHVASDFVMKNEVNGNLNCDSGSFLTWDAINKEFGCAGVSGASGGTVKTVTATGGSNPYLTVSADTINPAITLNVGTTAGTVAAGDDARFTNSRNPIGPAGGALSGTYPNPGLADNAVTNAKIADGAVTTSKLFANPGPGRLVMTDTTAGADLVAFSCAPDQLMKWTTTGWVCVNQTSLAVGSASVTTNFLGSLGGDVTGTQGSTVVEKIKGYPVNFTVAPTQGQILKLNSSGEWIAASDSNAGGTVTNVTGTAPIAVVNNTTTPVVSIAKATNAADGYLSAADWIVFNGKQNALGFTPLNPANNLSELTASAATARTNLGLGTAATLSAAALVGNAGGTPSIQTGTDGTKPASPTAGAIYFATDTKVIYQFNSGSWVAIASSAGAGGTITALTADVTASGNGTVNATVNSVGGSSAASVNAATVAANAATNLNTASTIVKRDVSGNFAAGAISAGSVVLRDSGSNTVTLQAPTTVTTSYVLKFPAAVGGANQVLTTDASGNLSWTTPAVTSGVAVTSPIVNSGTASAPNIGIQVANGTQNGYLSSADWTTFNNKLSATLAPGNIRVGNASSVATAVAPSGDVSMTNAGAFTVTKVQGTAVSATAPTAAGQVLRYNGTTQYAPSFLQLGDLRSTITPFGGVFASTACSASQTMYYNAATDTFLCQSISVTAANFANQAQNSFFAGPASGGAGAPAFRAIASADLPTVGTAGTYRSVTTDAYGRVTAGTNPTTAAGYGLTDVFVNGGNNFGADATLGTNSANSLILETNGAARMTVDSAGRIGIGQSPTTDGMLTIKADATTVASLKLDSVASGIPSIDMLRNGSWMGTLGYSSGGSNDLFVSNGVNGAIIFDTNNVEKVRISATGYLGVGTNAPGSTLHVRQKVSEAPFKVSKADGTDIMSVDWAGRITMDTNSNSTVPMLTIGNGNFGGRLLVLNGKTGNTSNLLEIKHNSVDRMVVTYDGKVGIGNAAPSEALEVTGNIKAASYLYTSDARLKKDVVTLPQALEKLLKLRGVNFVWKNNEEKTVGFIAQEVEAVYPDLVKTDKVSGYKSVQYGNITAILVEALKQEHAERLADKELCQSQIATVSRGLASVQQNSEVRMQQLEKENQDLKQRLERLEQALLKGK